VIVAEHLTRHFAGRAAVSDLSFEVPRAQVVGFLGPNGAGKSTTLKMLSGYLPPTSGTARIDGRDIVEESLDARALVGYMPESFPLPPEMRVDEYLRFRAELKGVRRDLKGAVARAMQLADVSDVSRRLLGELSKGYKQRVGLADAVVASPPLLILDEPTEGLDPNQIQRFRDTIRELGRNHTIFLSTHILSEVEAMCSHVVVIHRGRIAATGDLDTMRAELYGSARDVELLLRPKAQTSGNWHDDAMSAARNALGDVADAQVTRAELDTVHEGLVRIEVRIEAKRPEVIESLVARCVDAGLGVREVCTRRRSIEEVFHALTQDADATEKTS
jgi:ABC-2 type transport system ATP-binding protein